jgi:hypothetical protein
VLTPLTIKTWILIELFTVMHIYLIVLEIYGAYEGLMRGLWGYGGCRAIRDVLKEWLIR